MKLVISVILCFIVRETFSEVTWWDRHAASISCAAPGYFVNPVDCRSFYRCVDRSTWNNPALQRYDFKCPQGQIFDPAVSVCTQPGTNGCADPWWPPGSNGGGGKPGGSNDGNSNGIDLDDLPPLFGSGRGSNSKPGGGSVGGAAWFQGSRPAKDPSKGPGSGENRRNGLGFNKPSGGIGLGGGAAAGGGDPLDAEFGSSPDSDSRSLEDLGSSNSGGNNKDGSASDGAEIDLGFDKPSGSGGARASFGSGRPSLGFGGGGGDPLDAEFGGGPSDGSSTSFGGARPSLGFGGGGGGDPLDAEFGAPSPGPSSGSVGGSSRPSLGFGGGGGGGGDPLDAEFGTPSDGGGSSSLEDLNLNTPGGSSESQESAEPGKCLPANCKSVGGSTTTRPAATPSWFNRPKPKPTPNWDRNDPPNSGNFDPWNNNQLGQGNNRPSLGGGANANIDASWGGSPRPGFGDGSGNPFSPWRPTGPWGSGTWGSSTNNDNLPISSGNRNSSWWDPPYALPFHMPTAAPPPPEPWANPFRPRYPAYQILAYPTWPGPPGPGPGPGPYDRNPFIVVYSNSKKKK